MTEDNDRGGEQSGADEESRDPSSTPPSGNETNDAPPPTSPVRIAAVEAAVAAGLAPSTSRVEPPSTMGSDDGLEQTVVELPAWTEPPTGQVPRVLLDENADLDDSTYATRGPSWRQDNVDWEEEVDLSIFAPDPLSDEPLEIAGQQEIDDEDLHPYSFGDLGLSKNGDASEVEGGSDDEAWTVVLSDVAEDDDTYGLSSFGPSRSGRGQHRRGSHRFGSKVSDLAPDAQTKESAPTKSAPTKRVFVATLTGLGIAAIAIACFFLGAVATLVLATVVLSIGAGEFFAVLRRVGFQPAAAPGLVIVAGLCVGTYLRGASAVPFVLGVGFIAVGCWYISGRGGERPVINLGATFGGVVWIGVLGSFAGLLLAPSQHPHRHGVALLVGAIAITVAHDVGSYAAGSKLGRRHLAPGISPNKTVEGLLGGTVLAIVVALAIVTHLHPFGFALAFELAIGVAIIGPLGDLTESLIKRDLGVKDMGDLLPGHGGILDRIDAMLFVLPLTFYLASVHHIV